MAEFQNITYPLLNPNESEANIVAIHVIEGQKVDKGTLLYTIETTKSAADVEAPADGYIKGITASLGNTINAGEVFAYLSVAEDWVPPVAQKENVSEEENQSDIPDGVRISTPAMIFAEENQIDLDILPKGPFITIEAIKGYLPEENIVFSDPLPENPENVIIFGGGGHGKAIIELVQIAGVLNIVGLVDDNLIKGENILDVPILGNSDELSKTFHQGTRKAINAVGGIGRIQSRINVFNKLKEAGFSFPNIIHPTSFIEKSAHLSEGIQVFPFAYIGSDCEVGFGAILNTRCIISHDCILGEYVNISPGAILAGNVSVGINSLIGMGVTINLGVTIGENVKIGNGATIKQNVPDNQIVRAGTIWPN